MGTLPSQGRDLNLEHSLKPMPNKVSIRASSLQVRNSAAIREQDDGNLTKKTTEIKPEKNNAYKKQCEIWRIQSAQLNRRLAQNQSKSMLNRT